MKGPMIRVTVELDDSEPGVVPRPVVFLVEASPEKFGGGHEAAVSRISAAVRDVLDRVCGNK